MASSENITDEFTTKLGLEDDVTAKAEAIAAAYDAISKAAEAAGVAVEGAGEKTKDAGAKVDSQAAAWERVAARMDPVTAATVKLTNAQEQLARLQAQAAAGIAKGTADPDAVSRVLDAQIQSINRLKASLVEVRDAQEGQREASEQWKAGLAGGDGLLKLLASSAEETAAGVTRASAQIAVYGNSLEALRGRFDSVFATTKAYEADLALLNEAFKRGAIEGPGAQARALDELNAKYAQTAGGTTDLIAKNDALRASFDPLFAARQLQIAQLGRLQEAIQKTNIPTDVAAKALNDINATYAKSAQSATGGGPVDTSSYDKARASFDRAFAATQTLQAGMKQLEDVILNTNVSAEVAAARFNDLTAAYEEATAAAAENGATADETRAKYDPLFAETQRYSAALKTLEEEITGGLLPSYDVASAALDRLVAGHEKVVESITGERAALAADAAEQAKLAAATAAAATAMDSLRAKYDQDFAAQQRRLTQLRELQTVIQNTNISTTAAAQALNDINAAYVKATSGANGASQGANNVTVSHGQAAFAVRQLGVQTLQFFSSIEAGQSVLTAFVQQGHQVVDVALATGTGFGVLATAAKAAWAAIISPIGLVITGVSAATLAIVGLGYAAEVSARQQAKLRDELSATRTDYLAVADAVKQAGRDVGASTPASTADATTAAQTLAESPRIDASRQGLVQLTTTAQYLSQVLGKSLQDTATLIAQAAEDPAKVATSIASSTKALTDLDSVTLTTIIHMQQMGDVTGANALLMETFHKSVDVVKANQTELQRATEHLSEAMHGGGEATKSYWQNIGEAIDHVVAKTIDGIASMIDAINRWKNSMPQPSDPSKGGIFGGAMARWLDNLFGVGGPTGPTQVNSSIAPFVSQSAIANQLDPELLARLQSAEGVFANGQWQTSASGAVGPMQLLPRTFTGITQQPNTFPTAAGLTDVTQPEQNVAAGAALFAHLLNKYGDLKLAVLAYHDGETLVDQILAGGANAAPSQAGLDEVRKVLSGYSGTGFTTGVQPNLYTSPAVVGPQPLASIAASDAQKGALSLQNYDAQAKKLGELTEQLKLYNAALEAAKSANNTEQIDKYTKAVAQTQEEYAKAQNTLKATTDAYHDQAAAAGILGAAEQKNAEIRIAANRANQNQPLSAASEAQVAQEQAAAMAVLSAQFDQQGKKLDQSTKQTNDNADAILQGAAAVTQSTAAHKALIDVQDHFLQQDPAYANALARRTQQYLEAADAAKKAAVNQELVQNANTIQLLNAEISSLGQNADARELMIQHIKDEQEVRLKYGDTLQATQDKILAERDAIAKLNQTYRDNQATLSYLSQGFTTAFDNITNAMTQAFVQGSGAAVKWSNVMQGVVTQVIQMFAHLAILNPITNSLFGQNQPTLNSVANLFGGGSTASALGAVGTGLRIVDQGNGLFSLAGGSGGGGGGAGDVGSLIAASSLGLIGTQAVGAGGTVGGTFSAGEAAFLGSAGVAQQGAGGSSGGGLSGLLSIGGSLASIGKAFFPNTFSGTGGMFSGLGQSLGLTGEGGALTGLTSFLNTPVYSSLSGSLFPGATFASQGLSAGETGLLSSAGISAPTAGISTIGGIAGGIGAGYGVGSLIGGYEQKALGKVGPAPEIGAALGAGIGVASVVLAPATFGSSLLVGGLIGGAIGGIGGGLIGPKAPSSFSSTPVSLTPEGTLSVGDTSSQLRNASAERAGTISDVDTINQLLQSRGLTITSLEGANTAAKYFQIGQNTPGGFEDPSKYPDVSRAFPSLRFQSQDPLTQQFIQGRLFQSPEELGGVTQSLADFETALKGTSAESDTMGIALRALAGVANTDVQPALQKASTFLTATLPTLTAGAPGTLATAQSQVHAQFADALTEAGQLGFGTDQLTAAQQKLYDKNNKAATDAVDATAASVQSRYLTAHAAVTGDFADALAAQLNTFDSNAKQQAQQLSDTLTGVYGDAYATTADYAQRMADNDKATAEERLALQKQFNASSVDLTNQIVASTEQKLTLLARVATSAAALTGDPRQMQAASIQTLSAQQQIENVNFNASEKQTFGDNFATLDPNYATNIKALQDAQNNEMALLQQQIDRQNLELKTASDQQNQGLATRFTTAQAALNPTAYGVSSQLSAFDTQAQQEQQNLYLSLTQTYGTAYATTKEYSDKLLALQKAEGEERLVLEQTLADRTRQIAVASAQQDQSFATRYENASAQIAGTASPQQDVAQLDAFNAQAGAEMQNLRESLLSTYGDAYASTADYGNKIAALTAAQGEERLALEDQFQQKQLQQYVANAQQIASLQGRIVAANAIVAGTPQAADAAQRAQLQYQQVAEQQNLAVSLRAQYGAGYATDPAARQMITLLQQAQQAEQASLAVQQRQADAQRATATTEQSADFTVRYFEAYLKRTSATPDALEAYSVTALQAQQQKERDQLRLSNTDTTGSQMQELVAAQAQETALLVQQNRQADIQRGFQGQQQDASFSVRYAVAAAGVSGSQSAANAAALLQFDTQAKAEQQNLYLSLIQTYGVAYTTTVDYAKKVTALQKAEGEERLALAQQQNDALKATATSSIQSLVQYAQSLRTSSLSPLSPTAQLTIAQKEFATQSGLASSGNFAAVQTLQQYADAYLNAAHTVYGSGTNYVQAFSQVISTLASVGAASPDALTASVLASETRGQTAILVEQLQELQDEVKQLRLQISQGNLAPARV